MRDSGLKLYFDGGCRPNPGRLEIAVVARGETYFSDDLGCGSNNDAEWIALLAAARIARDLGERRVVLLGDAMLVVQQARGAWKCRGAALQHHAAQLELVRPWFTRLHFRQVARSHNLAGIALAQRREGRRIAFNDATRFGRGGLLVGVDADEPEQIVAPIID